MCTWLFRVAVPFRRCCIDVVIIILYLQRELINWLLVCTKLVKHHNNKQGLTMISVQQEKWKFRRYLMSDFFPPSNWNIQLPAASIDKTCHWTHENALWLTECQTGYWNNNSVVRIGRGRKQFHIDTPDINSERRVGGKEKIKIEMMGLEAQWVRGDHSSVLHHGCGDGPQILEDLPGLTGAQGLDLPHDPVMGLHAPGVT